MADSEYTIGPVGGECTNLNVWESLVDDETGIHVATIIEDLEEQTCTVGPTVNPWSATIKGSETGIDKIVIGVDRESVGINLYGQDTMDAMTFEDLIFDGSDVKDGEPLLYAFRGGDVTVKRCWFKESDDGFGIKVSANLVGDILIENCIAERLKYGYMFYQAAGQTITLKNCLAANCSTMGYYISDTDQVITFYNCIGIEEAVASLQFSIAGTTSTAEAYSCVEAYSSWDNGFDNTPGDDGCVAGKTAVTDYFEDWDGYDFRLKADDNTLWGTNGNSANTPAEDFASVTRTNDDIGPFEYISFSPAIAQCGRTMRMGVGLGI